ncbi:hypothetical protein [Falsiphaeobacter marinintestinus]|uniref:hypothetical protein n=1 Tax=Falsiphaeobacter marinintestinus TaxID=1492905 RepID=UPI0011B441D5|nr:hypothetical protein [Phaeobacter marinintestinus]
MAKQKWQKPTGDRDTAFEDLRRQPDELRLVVGALAPLQSHDACVSMLYHVLRNWNYRSPRLDRHIGGEWLFRTHDQLVFYGVATSYRTSKRILNLLDDADLIERRKAHLGDRQHVLHLAPSTPLLRLLQQLNKDMFRRLDAHEKPRVLRYLCDRSVKCGPKPLEAKTLPFVGKLMRSDKAYGSSQRVQDLDDAMDWAMHRYKEKPDPFVSPPVKAKSGPYAQSVGANSGTYQPDEGPNLAPTIKVKGDKVKGDKVEGDSGHVSIFDKIKADMEKPKTDLSALFEE